MANSKTQELNKVDIEFNQYIDMTDVKDSMQLDSDQVIACMKFMEKKATIEVCGLVKVYWNPDVKPYADDAPGALDGEYFRYPSEFPKELKELIKNKPDWETDCRVYISENNWFECCIYDSGDRYITSYTVDVEGLSSEEIRDMLLDAIKNQ